MADQKRPARRFDPSAVLAGLLFGAAAAFFLVLGTTGRSPLDVRVIVASVFVGLGLVGIARAIIHVRDRSRPSDQKSATCDRSR
ncbi:hypothetical protein [Actinomadura atramentaria]|uniref:hypothetical protein n=1 Tax=Actinomadura atramentaria TaxID=1990 RepID=UPI00036318B2|nr:hypothetical protein [Actinomadura atramentaria]